MAKSKKLSQIAECQVTVAKKDIVVKSVSLNKTSAEIKESETLSLVATVTPNNATNKTVTFKTSNAKIATVDAKGNVKGLKAGNATITASSGGKSATCKVTVKANIQEVAVTQIKLNISKKEIGLGSTFKLKVTIKPNNATNKNVTWTSSNKSIVTVNSSGKVTAKGEGNAIITAKTSNGKQQTCEVTVVNYNRYYYNQITDEASKIIYEVLTNNKEKLKENQKIDLGDRIIELFKNKTVRDRQKCLATAASALRYDQPDMFYIDWIKMVTKTKTVYEGGRHYLATGYLYDNLNKKEIEREEKVINGRKQGIIKEMDGWENDKEKIRDLSYIIGSVPIFYGDATNDRYYIFGINGPLCKNRSVCTGYAETMKFILDEMHIPCIIVTGQPKPNVRGGSHAWNYVKIDDKWYLVDAVRYLTGGVLRGKDNPVFEKFVIDKVNCFGTSYVLQEYEFPTLADEDA